jgi:hypothetical protein
MLFRVPETDRRGQAADESVLGGEMTIDGLNRFLFVNVMGGCLAPDGYEISGVYPRVRLCKRCGQKPLLHKVPNYYADLNLLFEVVEKLRQSGRWCCISIYSDYDFIWQVRFTASADDDTTEHKPSVEISGHDLPASIMEACKAAVGERL